MFLDGTGSPPNTWLLCALYVIDLQNHLASHNLQGNITPIKKAFGYVPDISKFLQFHWWQCVLYKSDTASFPSETYEGLGCFVGVANNIVIFSPTMSLLKIPVRLFPIPWFVRWIQKTLTFVFYLHQTMGSFLNWQSPIFELLLRSLIPFTTPIRLNYLNSVQKNSSASLSYTIQLMDNVYVLK